MHAALAIQPIPPYQTRDGVQWQLCAEARHTYNSLTINSRFCKRLTGAGMRPTRRSLADLWEAARACLRLELEREPEMNLELELERELQRELLLER